MHMQRQEVIHISHSTHWRIVPLLRGSEQKYSIWEKKVIWLHKCHVQCSIALSKYSYWFSVYQNSYSIIPSNQKFGNMQVSMPWTGWSVQWVRCHFFKSVPKSEPIWHFTSEALKVGYNLAISSFCMLNIAKWAAFGIWALNRMNTVP